MRSVAPVVLLASTLLTPALAAERGPAVGQPIPTFSAQDQDGRPRTFDDLRGPKGLVLLFFRSADW